MSVMEKAIVRAGVALVSLILFVFLLCFMSMQEKIDKIEKELEAQKVYVQEVEDHLEREIKAYSAIYDAIITGINGGW